MGLRPDELISSIMRYLELKLKLIAAKTQLSLSRLVTIAVLWGGIILVTLISLILSSIALGAWIGSLLGAWYLGLLLVGLGYGLVALALYFFRYLLLKKIQLVVGTLVQRITDSEDSAI